MTILSKQETVSGLGSIPQRIVDSSFDRYWLIGVPFDEHARTVGTVQDTTPVEVFTNDPHGLKDGDTVVVGATDPATGLEGFHEVRVLAPQHIVLVGTVASGLSICRIQKPRRIVVDGVLLNGNTPDAAGAQDFSLVHGDWALGDDAIHRFYLDPTEQDSVRDGVGRARSGGLNIWSDRGLMLVYEGSFNPFVVTVLYRDI